MDSSDVISPLDGNFNRIRSTLNSDAKDKERTLNAEIRNIAENIDLEGISQRDLDTLHAIFNPDEFPSGLYEEIENLKELAAKKFSLERTEIDDYSHEIQKIIDYAKKKSPFLRRSALKGQRYHRREMTKLKNSFQVELPRGIETKADEIKIIILLKPQEKGAFKEKPQNVILLGTGSQKVVEKTLEISRLTSEHPLLIRRATAKPKPSEDQDVYFKRKLAIENEWEILKEYQGKRGIIQCVGHCVYPMKAGRGSRIWKKLTGGGDKMKVNMVMNFAAQDLHERLKQGPIPFAKRSRWMLDILYGLNTVHESGIVHSDIKPQNIVISEEGEAQLADFGLSYLMARRQEGIRGTPRFMSIEMYQAKYFAEKYKETHNPHFLDAARNALASIGSPTDLYSLGLVFYVMKNGKLPYKASIKNPENYSEDFKVIEQSLTDMMGWYSEQMTNLFPEVTKQSAAKIKPKKMNQMIESLDDESEKELALILMMMHPEPQFRPSANDALEAFKSLYSDEV